MPYTALPDHRIPYDNDGSEVGYGDESVGVIGWLSGANKIEINDSDMTWIGNLGVGWVYTWLFFPEQREVTGYVYWIARGSGWPQWDSDQYVKGSNNSTNGLDGTWETASLPSGQPSIPANVFVWREIIKPVSFTGGKRTVRVGSRTIGGYTDGGIMLLHLYGEKQAGQTPDDIIYINHDDTPGVEYTASEDFGDQPLDTTVVRQFRLKNTSATKTANTINIQCNDSLFAISENGSTWVTTINITSLAAGAESATLYVRCTTPAIGALLGPYFARIVTTVASYT